MAEHTEHTPMPVEASYEAAASAPERAGELTRDDFEHCVEDIDRALEYGLLHDWPARKIHAEIYREYVTEAENPRLARFADLLLTSENAARAQHGLDRLQERGQRDSADFARLKRATIKYNHLLRDVIAEQPRLFSREQLSRWLESSSGDRTWSERLMRGMIAEVAVAQRLEHVPGVRGVRYSTAEEELEGVDVVAELEDGGECRIDVKFGDRQRQSDVYAEPGGMVVRINGHEVAGFGIAPASRETVNHRLGRAVSYARP